MSVIVASTMAIVVADAENSVLPWVTALGTVGATIAAVALGLGFKEWVLGPRLQLRFSPTSGSELVLTGAEGGPVEAYVRLRVANDGKTAANRVHVSVLSIETWAGDAGWTRTRPEIDGAILLWPNRHGEPFLDIPRKSERPLDLFTIARNLNAQGNMPIRLKIGSAIPADLPDQLRPGAWRLRLEASADNASPKRYYLAFRFDGAWPGDRPEDIWRAVAVEGPSVRPQAHPPEPELQDPAEMLGEAAQRGEG